MRGRRNLRSCKTVFPATKRRYENVHLQGAKRRAKEEGEKEERHTGLSDEREETI